jgi:hypothetical protein
MHSGFTCATTPNARDIPELAKQAKTREEKMLTVFRHTNRNDQRSKKD